VEVRRKLRVGLLCTGDEIVSVGTPLERGKIYNANEVMLRTKMEALGIEVRVLPMVDDCVEDIVSCIRNHWDTIDLLVTTGGVSVGKRDMMHEVIASLGATRLFWRIQMQPGTPVLAAYYKGKLMVGLSGNPFAALVNFELVVMPLIGHMLEDETIIPTYTRGVMQTSFMKKSHKRRFIRVRYNEGKVVINHTNHASGALYTMAECNALVDIAAGTDCLLEGQEVRVILLNK
ncbi:MAG: molybdopterin molybdotransferase MoeA, partial [Cellulosilyticaceae bacterium]